MMVAATISEMMAAAFGRDWPESGGMKIRFRSPVKPGAAYQDAGQRPASGYEGRRQKGLVFGIGCER